LIIHATLALIRVFFDDLHSTAFGVVPDDIHLVAGQVLEVLRRHPHVSGSMVGW
jgi:hypothetical protein